MRKALVVAAASIIVALLAPLVATADYFYLGSTALQPLAVIEPATPDSLFQTWTGDVELNGRQNLGLSMDFLRNENNSDDWDIIFSATGSFRTGEKLLLGVTAPYLIRDPDFNESGLLDLRVFARMRLLGEMPGFRVSGELSGILPTGSKDSALPLSLDTPVVGARLALAGGSGKMRAGASVGYQTYLETQSGSDSDLIYGLWMERELKGSWKLAGVYSSSVHDHSGAPGDEQVTDGYLQVGVRRTFSRAAEIGLAVGSSAGGDSVADLRITATATFRFGEIKEVKKAVRDEEVEPVADKKVVAKEKAAAPAKPVAPVYSGPVVVMIAEGIADRDTERNITRTLQKEGFATGMDPDPEIKVGRKNILWYNKGMKEQAARVLLTLLKAGDLKDLEIMESKKPIMRNWMILVLGAERK